MMRVRVRGMCAKCRRLWGIKASVPENAPSARVLFRAGGLPGLFWMASILIPGGVPGSEMGYHREINIL